MHEVLFMSQERTFTLQRDKVFPMTKKSCRKAQAVEKQKIVSVSHSAFAAVFYLERR